MSGKEPFYQLHHEAAVTIAIFLEETPDPKLYPALSPDDDIWGLMKKCWDPNPHQRFSVSQVIYKANLLIEAGSKFTSRSAGPQSDGNRPIAPAFLTGESIIQAGIKVSTLPPALSGALERAKYIGAGRCGDVHQGSWTLPGKDPVLVAMKSIRSKGKGQTSNESTNELFVKIAQRETVIWKATEHPNILQFYGYWIIDAKPLLISPWCENGNLSSYLAEHPGLTEAQKLNVVSPCTLPPGKAKAPTLLLRSAMLLGA
ncbi:hypothetical protein FRC01_003284 [Tulasnella sp. 417]|nr:hypothetical protein FRC01_003284 [Tulasnella sp. 417]